MAQRCPSTKPYFLMHFFVALSQSSDRNTKSCPNITQSSAIKTAISNPPTAKPRLHHTLTKPYSAVHELHLHLSPRASVPYLHLSISSEGL